MDLTPGTYNLCGRTAKIRNHPTRPEINGLRGEIVGVIRSQDDGYDYAWMHVPSGDLGLFLHRLSNLYHLSPLP